MLVYLVVSLMSNLTQEELNTAKLAQQMIASLESSLKTCRSMLDVIQARCAHQEKIWAGDYRVCTDCGKYLAIY